MKNKIKKILFATFFLSVTDFSIFAFSKSDVEFSVSPHFGIMAGQLDEYIFSSSDDSVQKSLLEWELKPLYCAGLKSKVGLKNFYLNADLNFSLPLKCGILRDSDWNADGSTKIIYSELEEKNHFSFTGGLETGWNFYFENPLHKKGSKSSFLVTPAASFYYSYFKIKSDDGYGYFGGEDYSANGEEVAWNSPYATYHKTYGINLTREYFLIFTGIRLGMQITPEIDFSAGVFFSPFAYIATYDSHLRKEGSYSLNGFQQGSFEYYKFDFLLSYRFSKKIYFFSEMGILIGKLMKGDFYHNYYSEKPQLSSQKSGSKTFIFNVEAGIRFLLSF